MHICLCFSSKTVRYVYIGCRTFGVLQPLKDGKSARLSGNVRRYQDGAGVHILVESRKIEVDFGNGLDIAVFGGDIILNVAGKSRGRYQRTADAAVYPGHIRIRFAVHHPGCSFFGNGIIDYNGHRQGYIGNGQVERLRPGSTHRRIALQVQQLQRRIAGDGGAQPAVGIVFASRIAVIFTAVAVRVGEYMVAAAAYHRVAAGGSKGIIGGGGGRTVIGNLILPLGTGGEGHEHVGRIAGIVIFFAGKHRKKQEQAYYR